MATDSDSETTNLVIKQRDSENILITNTKNAANNQWHLYQHKDQVDKLVEELRSTKKRFVDVLAIKSDVKTPVVKEEPVLTQLEKEKTTPKPKKENPPKPKKENPPKQRPSMAHLAAEKMEDVD